jgi:Protein of unknown function (DUF1670)
MRNDRISRAHYKACYGPLAQKTLPNILKRELMEQFGFENMGLIADRLIERFLEILDRYRSDKVRLLPGQALWLAVAVDEKCGYGKTMMRSRLVPVTLTLVAPSDIEQMAAERKTFKELRPQLVARLLKEAKGQGGVLALTDVGLLLGISIAAVSSAVREYQKQHPGETLPYRGTIHDMGPTVTHKLQAIELKLMGCLTQEIARRIHHDPTNVDIYQNDFERVYQLHRDGKDPNQISFLTRLSRQLVRQYIELIDRYVIERTKTKDKRCVSKNGYTKTKERGTRLLS